VNVSGSVSEGSAVSSGTTWFQANLQSSATVTLTRSAPTIAMVLCLQRRVPTPAVTQLNADACTSLLTFQGDNQTTVTQTVTTLTNERWYYALYFAPNASTANAVQVTLLISGATCQASRTWNGSVCLNATKLTLDTPKNLVLSSGVAAYARFTVAPMFGRVQVAVTGSDGAPLPQVALLVRTAGTPSDGVSDAAGNATVAVSYPRPAEWFVRLVSSDAADLNATITLTGDNCTATPDRQGPQCAVNVTLVTADQMAAVNLSLGEVAYFRVSTSDLMELWVSAYDELTDLQPSISASLGQLPQLGTADVSACNTAVCAAPSIVVPNGTLGWASNVTVTWYVALTAAVGAGNQSNAGIWIDSLCATNCEQHGTCGSDDQAGICLCVSDYQGVDCSTPSGSMMGAQYIVLIIIASLVVASAVIGFIAWAYMRRKRAAYDKVAG